MTVSGSPDVAIVLRSGADNEMTSGLVREETRLIADAPGVARNADGPLASAELFVIINLPKRSTGTDANVPLRGVEQPRPRSVRGDIKIVAGPACSSRAATRSSSGVGAARAFAGLDVGQTAQSGPERLDSRRHLLRRRRHRRNRKSGRTPPCCSPPTTAATPSNRLCAGWTRRGAFQQFKDALTTQSAAQGQGRSRQAEFLRRAIQRAHAASSPPSACSSPALMALGALFGALNTMYSAVAARTREIATLRALGFGAARSSSRCCSNRWPWRWSAAPSARRLAYLAFDGFQAATINWQTFSQVAFAFAVTPGAVAQGDRLAAAVIGLIGGLFPAIRAARLPIAAALREV